MLALRQAQEKALDELQKRADLRISEKMDTVTRQAQAIRDRTANLLDQHPWIQGIGDADFTPDSCLCQIVFRNCIKFVSQGQTHLAHEYLFTWTRAKKDNVRLEGSAYDFLELARFAEYILNDQYLSMLILGQGRTNFEQGVFIAPLFLKALSRLGLVQDATLIANHMRRRLFPKWLRRTLIRIMPRRYLCNPAPSVEEFAALAVFAGVMGDPKMFNRAISRAKQLVSGPSRSASTGALVRLNELEGALRLGIPYDDQCLTESLNGGDCDSPVLVNERIWTLRCCGRFEEADSVLRGASKNLNKQLFAKRKQGKPPAGDHHTDDWISDETESGGDGELAKEAIPTTKGRAQHQRNR